MRKNFLRFSLRRNTCGSAGSACPLLAAACRLVWPPRTATPPSHQPPAGTPTAESDPYLLAERRRAEEGRHRQDAASREDGAVLPTRGARMGLAPPYQPAAVLLLLRRTGRVRLRGRGLPPRGGDPRQGRGLPGGGAVQLGAELRPPGGARRRGSR